MENGFAVASLDFRLSMEAGFPAQIHDIKVAVRSSLMGVLGFAAK